MKLKFTKRSVSFGLVMPFTVWLVFVAANIVRAAGADIHYQTAEEYDPSALVSFINQETREIIRPPNPPKPRYLPAEASLPSNQDLNGNWSEVTAGLQMSVRFLKSETKAGDPVTAVVLLRNVSQEYIAVPVYCDDELFSFVVTRNGRNIPGPLPDRFHPQKTYVPFGNPPDVANEVLLVIPPQTQTRHDIAVSAWHDMKEPGEYVITAIRTVIAPGAFLMDKTGTQPVDPTKSPPLTVWKAMDTQFTFGAKKIPFRRPEVPYVELKSGNAIVQVVPSAGASHTVPNTGEITPRAPSTKPNSLPKISNDLGTATLATFTPAETIQSVREPFSTRGKIILGLIAALLAIIGAIFWRARSREHR